MGNRYYASGDARAAKVQELFTGIARRYDLLNDLQTLGAHRRWKKITVRETNPQRGETVLDLCSGTGDLIAPYVEKGCAVIGADLTLPMLEVARGRIPSAAHLVQADALRLPFRDNTFDIVSVGYGLRNLADLGSGLREIFRVLKPRGRFAALDFGKPRNAIWRKLYFAYLASAVPVVGLLFARDPAAYAYILESLKKFPGPDELKIQMEAARFRDVQVRTFATGTMALLSGMKAAA